LLLFLIIVLHNFVFISGKKGSDIFSANTSLSVGSFGYGAENAFSYVCTDCSGSNCFVAGANDLYSL
jgi:hypothetical protein